MTKPYLIAEIPFGKDGHVTVREPGTPLPHDEIVGIVQKVRDSDFVKQPGYLSVARQSLQFSSGRVGRAVLVLCQLDTAELSPESLDDLRNRLTLRLDSLASLGQHESLQNARGGSLIDCPLFSTWSNLDQFDTLPGIPGPKPDSPPPSSKPPRATGTDPKTRWTAPRKGIVPVALTVAALALIGLATSSYWSRKPKQPEPAVVDPGKTAQVPKPSPDPEKVRPAPTVDPLANLRSELAKARKGGFDLRPPENRERLDRTWPFLLAEGAPTEEKTTLFAEYQKIFREAFDGTLKMAGDERTKVISPLLDPKALASTDSSARLTLELGAQLDAQAKLITLLDTWLRKCENGRPGLTFVAYQQDFHKLANGLRVKLQDDATERLLNLAKRLLLAAEQGARIPWQSLKRIGNVAEEMQATRPATETTSGQKDRMAKFSRLVKELDGRSISVDFKLITFNGSEDDEVVFEFSAPSTVSFDLDVPREGKGISSFLGGKGGNRVRGSVDTNGMQIYRLRTNGGKPSDLEFRGITPFSSLFDARFTISERGGQAGDEPHSLSGSKILWTQDATPVRKTAGFQWRMSASVDRSQGNPALKQLSETLSSARED